MDCTKKTLMLLLINKLDKRLDKKKFAEFEMKISQITKHNIERHYVSAFTNEGIKESLKKFFLRIFNEYMIKEEIKEIKEFDEEEEINVILYIVFIMILIYVYLLMLNNLLD